MSSPFCLTSGYFPHCPNILYYLLFNLPRDFVKFIVNVSIKIELILMDSPCRIQPKMAFWVYISKKDSNSALRPEESCWYQVGSSLWPQFSTWYAMFSLLLLLLYYWEWRCLFYMPTEPFPHWTSTLLSWMPCCGGFCHYSRVFSWSNNQGFIFCLEISNRKRNCR